MKKNVSVLIGAFLIFLAGCSGGENEVNVPAQCAWQGPCPDGWTASGNTCVYNGDTVTIEGKVTIYSLGSVVPGAVVKVYDVDTLLPPCGVSDSDGYVTISGIPVNTDVTISVSASGGFNNNPTYYFHFLKAETDEKDLEFVFINQFLGNTILQLLAPFGVTEIESGKGVIAGAVELSSGAYAEGATVVAVSGNTEVHALYLSFAEFPPSVTDSGTYSDSGVYVIPNVPAGEVQLRVYLQGSNEPVTYSAVVYDGTISLVGTEVQ